MTADKLGDRYDSLANAVVMAAIRDLRRLLVRRRNLKTKTSIENNRCDIERIRRFFFSQEFALFTSLDPETLWEAVVREEENEYQRREKKAERIRQAKGAGEVIDDDTGNGEELGDHSGAEQ